MIPLAFLLQLQMFQIAFSYEKEVIGKFLSLNISIKKRWFSNQKPLFLKRKPPSYDAKTTEL